MRNKFPVYPGITFAHTLGYFRHNLKAQRHIVVFRVPHRPPVYVEHFYNVTVIQRVHTDSVHKVRVPSAGQGRIIRAKARGDIPGLAPLLLTI
jgi:hypothetical protein